MHTNMVKVWASFGIATVFSLAGCKVPGALTLDPTFGDASSPGTVAAVLGNKTGMQILDSASGGPDTVAAVLQAPDNGLFVVGTHSTAVVMGNSSFSLPQLFVAQGRSPQALQPVPVALPPALSPPNYLQVSSAVIQSLPSLPYRILIAARALQSPSGTFQSVILALNAQGQLDTSFAGAGYLIANLPAQGQTLSNAPDSIATGLDGSIYLGGHSFLSSGQFLSPPGVAYLVKFPANPVNGTPSLSFPLPSLAPVSYFDSAITAIGIQSDGKLAVAEGLSMGFATAYQTALLRFTADGQLDPTLNPLQTPSALGTVNSILFLGSHLFVSGAKACAPGSGCSEEAAILGLALADGSTEMEYDVPASSLPASAIVYTDTQAVSLTLGAHGPILLGRAFGGAATTLFVTGLSYDQSSQTTAYVTPPVGYKAQMDVGPYGDLFFPAVTSLLRTSQGKLLLAGVAQGAGTGGVLFAESLDWAPAFGSSKTLSISGGGFCDGNTKLLVGDLNGDGKPDMVCMGYTLGGMGYIYVSEQTSGGSSTPSFNPWYIAGRGCDSASPDSLLAPLQTGGANQLFCISYNSGLVYRAATSVQSGNAFFTAQTVPFNPQQPLAYVPATDWKQLPSFTPSASAKILTGDVNGDGNTDLIRADFATGALSVSQGDGNGNFGGWISVAHLPAAARGELAFTANPAPAVLYADLSQGNLYSVVFSLTPSLTARVGQVQGLASVLTTRCTTLALADLTGTGRQDIFCHARDYRQNYVALGTTSLGTDNLGNPVLQFEPWNASLVNPITAAGAYCGLQDRFLPIDLDGDGLADLVCHNPGSDSKTIQVGLGL